MGYGAGGHWFVWMEWRPAGWSVSLPLLIFPCTIKSSSSLLAPADPGGPGEKALKWLWWHVTAHRQTKPLKPTDFACESASRLLPSTSTITIYYCYSTQRLIIILPSHGGWKAESTVALQ